MTTFIGLVFTVALVATVTAVLMAMADVARHRPQGGSTAIVVRYATEEPPRVRVPSRPLLDRYRHEGRHRK